MIFQRKKPERLTLEVLDERLRAKEEEAARLWQWINFLNHARASQHAEQPVRTTLH